MSKDRSQDEAAIRAVLARSYQAWQAGDADGMVADYAEDATAIMPGSLRDGRAVIRDSMAAAFAGPLAGSRTDDEQLGLRFVGRDAAVVVSRSGVVLAGEQDVPEERQVHATWVLEQRDGRWLVAAYHNSPVVAAGR